MIQLRHYARHFSGKSAPFKSDPAMEVIYRDLFLRELARLGEEDRFFPTGGAANYSLLYLILRIATELRPAAVLDIGAGQSTLLWSMLHRRGLVGDVVTLENDAEWGERIGSQVGHRVIISPLRPTLVDGRSTDTYDWSLIGQAARFDVIVCDGPRGIPCRSRCGVLAMVEKLAPDFVLIFDDAERPGEQDSIARAHARLQAQGREYALGIVRAAKSQAVFAGGRFLPATFM